MPSFGFEAHVFDRTDARQDGEWHEMVVAGWLLFIVSALFFIVAAWRAGDMLALAGDVFFLVACFSFLVPIVRRAD